MEDTPYGQPTLANPIGTEVDDPKYKKGRGCFIFFRCRRSDAARAVYEGGVTFTLGKIAKPTFGPNETNLSKAVKWGGATHFTITAEGGAIMNTLVNKVGRTTG